MLKSALILTLLLSGCTHFASYQTARTLPKGKSEYVYGGSLYHYLGSPRNDDGDLSTALLGLDFRSRHGVGRGIDVGLGLASSISGTLDVKVELLELGETFFLASGYGFFLLASRETPRQIDHFVPIYASFHATNWLALYSSFRGVYCVTMNSNDYYSDDWEGERFGGVATAGLKVGADYGVYAEHTRAKFENGFLQSSQTSLGYFVSGPTW